MSQMKSNQASVDLAQIQKKQYVVDQIQRFKFTFTSSTLCWLSGLVGIFGISGTIGCSTENLSNTEIDVTSSDTGNQPLTRVVPTTGSTNATSPAMLADAEIDETDPLQVCHHFMELLQAGNQLGAENLLTKRALVVTGQAELALEPLSDIHSTFELSAPKFNSLKNEIAYIDCLVKDQPSSEIQASVTWILKKQSSNNWRISGLMLSDERMATPRMVSFENPTDVQWMKESDEEDSESGDQD